jgi:hypothetical protein
MLVKRLVSGDSTNRFRDCDWSMNAPLSVVKSEVRSVVKSVKRLVSGASLQRGAAAS